MARPGLTQHRKFLRLARVLGNAPLALGCLELMWEKCYLNGEPYLGDVIDVEAAAQWPGEPGALCRALLDAGGDSHKGFIEELVDRPGHFQCHDLFDHAPRYVEKRMQRELSRKEKGQTLSQMRSDAGRKGAEAGKRTANGQQTDSKRQQVDATPAPAPAPAPRKDSPEPDESDSTPVVLVLHCVGGRDWPLTEGRLAKWREAFPHLDLMHEARKMALYLDDNPHKRKTFGGMGKFTLGWLGRAQDGGSARASPGRVVPLRGIAADASTRADLQQVPLRKLLPAGVP